MNFLTILVASSIINFQQAVQPPTPEQTVDTTKPEQIATDYLKLRFSDADFIQTTVVKDNNGKDVEVYLAFSAESTPVNTCQVHMHLFHKKKIHVERISCVNYQKKIGFQEDINSTVYR